MDAPLRNLFLALSLAIGLGFLLAGPGQAAAATLTLEAEKKRLRLPNKPVNLSGRLSGIDGLSGPGGQTISLYATPYPYTSETPVTSTTTSAEGDFSFSPIATDRNTRYHVEFDGDVLEGDAQSDPVQIFVFPDVDYSFEIARNRFAKASFEFIYSSGVQPEYYVGRSDMHWYFRKARQASFRRVATTVFTDTPRGVLSKLRWELPRGTYRFFFVPCVDAPAADIGIGNDKPFKCPRKARARAAHAPAGGAPDGAFGSPVFGRTG